MKRLVVVNDPEEGQAAVPAANVEQVLAMAPAQVEEWRCGNGCYGFVVGTGRPAERSTVWVINAECRGDVAKLPRELVREALYR